MHGYWLACAACTLAGATIAFGSDAGAIDASRQPMERVVAADAPGSRATHLAREGAPPAWPAGDRPAGSFGR